MKRRLVIGISTLGLLLGTALFAADEIKLDGVTCPVSGKSVGGAEVEYKTGKVFLCCENCSQAFEANPAKYAVKANQQLVTTGQATEVKCPLTGRDLNPSTAIDVGG